jgi:hypothetical protein
VGLLIRETSVAWQEIRYGRREKVAANRCPPVVLVFLVGYGYAIRVRAPSSSSSEMCKSISRFQQGTSGHVSVGSGRPRAPKIYGVFEKEILWQ